MLNAWGRVGYCAGLFMTGLRGDFLKINKAL
jgi:hypothetical protein